MSETAEEVWARIVGASRRANPGECPECANVVPERIVWQDEFWILSRTDGPTDMAAALLLQTREHTRVGQLDDDLASQFGRISNRLVRIVENLPDVVAAKAEEYAGDAASPIEQVRAIERGLKTNGFLSHGLASDAVPSRAGHGADRLIELFTRSQMVGDEEQYAAAMALMVRHLGYPARVVMGYAPEVAEGDDEVEVVGADVTAWVEVPFEGVGWVSFRPTPDNVDVPQEQTPKPKSEPQPQVRQPPRAEQAEDETDRSRDEGQRDPGEQRHEQEQHRGLEHGQAPDLEHFVHLVAGDHGHGDRRGEYEQAPRRHAARPRAR